MEVSSLGVSLVDITIARLEPCDVAPRRRGYDWIRLRTQVRCHPGFGFDNCYIFTIYLSTVIFSVAVNPIAGRARIYRTNTLPF
jgi:hypothetical protein